MRSILGLLLLLPIASFAAETLPEAYNEFDPALVQDIQDLNSRNNRYWTRSVGFRAANYTYTEPGLMELSGVKAGFGAETSYYPNGIVFSQSRISLDGEYMEGRMDYDGGFIGTNEAYKSKDTSRIALAKGRIERKLAPMGRFQTWIGAGLAYRYLTTLGESKYMYRRDQTYLYAPLTISLEQSLNDISGLVLALEYDFLIEGENKTHVGNGMHFKQKSGNGIGAKVQFERQISSTWFYSNINYHRWAIGESSRIYIDDNRYWYEPKNNTDQFGIGLGAFF